MVLGQPLDVVRERVEPRGCKHPGLPHRAAQLVPDVAGGHCHGLVRHHDDRSDRRPEALGQADGERVEDRAVLRVGHPARDLSVPDARAVAVQIDVVRRRERADLLELRERVDGAATAVVRLFDGDRARGHGVVAVEAQLRLDLLRREQAALGDERAGL